MSSPNETRVPAGVPTGGQFAMSARDEAAVVLSDEAAPHDGPRVLREGTGDPFPGSHKVVECERCASDPARRDEPGCAYCDHGRVTTDRYGQVPWHPEAPGTKVGFEEPRTGEWTSATMTAMTSESSEYFAVGLLADNTARDIYLNKAIPLHAAQAAARHGVNGPEMIAETACEMHVGVDPDLGEIRAFLARIDDGYVEDIARSAREFRAARAAELREEGRTGPALDRTVDPASLDSAAIDRAIEQATDPRAYASMTYVVDREHWHGHTVVKTPTGRIATYKDTAWDRPEQQPLLPWTPPEGIPVAHVALDGTVTRVDRP